MFSLSQIDKPSDERHCLICEQEAERSVPKVLASARDAVRGQLLKSQDRILRISIRFNGAAATRQLKGVAGGYTQAKEV
jgi:hypothetical protein